MPNRYHLSLALGASLLLAVPLAAQAPTGTVRGRITDAANQQPIARATVSASGRSTVTQADGRYVLVLPTGAQTLAARIIGYAPTTRSLNIAEGQTLDVDLELNAQAVSLAEIVVVGYGEQTAGNQTGARTSLTVADFNPGRIVSPIELIQNKAAGVQVVENNEPGGGTSVRIRGATSVNASSEPLYVIDGVPVGTGAGGGLSAGRDPLNFLNPGDIENITVLRDASAAAIYGANAANGVILITTRSGETGPQFSYSGSMSASSVTRLPEMLNASQYRAAIQQYYPASVSFLSSANTNWFDLVTRSAVGQEHNLSMAGAGGTMNYRMSLGWLNQEGVVRGTNTQRLSLGLNYGTRLFSDRLDVRANLRGSRSFDRFTPGGVLSNAAQMGPTEPVLDAATQTGYYDWSGNLLTSADNPVAILALASDRGVTLRSVGNLQAEYRVPFLEGLRANVNLGFDVARADRKSFYPSVLHSESKTGEDGSDYRSNQSQTNSLLETYLNYTVPRNIGPGILDLMGGYSYNTSSAEYPWFRATGLATDLLGGNAVVTARQTQNFQDVQESRLISFFGRVNYNVGDKYLAGVTVRRDGSSRFGPEHQWGTFPSVSVGWRLSQEPFLRDITAISDLKLRASWARTGNQAFANYQQYSRYLVSDAQTQYQFGTEYVSTIRPSAYDPGIRWEQTTSTNVGVDYGFRGQRFSGSVDWYKKDTEDLIFEVPVPAGTNLSNFVTTNIGSMRNSGFELSLNARLIEPRAGRGFHWNADLTASRNTNELVSINPVFGDSVQLQRVLTGLVAGGVGTFIQVLQPGEPINSFYVYEHIRTSGRPIYEDRTGLANNAAGRQVFTGTPDGTINEQDLYVDINGDSVINQEDRRPFHDPAPKWILGFSSYMGYGNFDFGFTLRRYMGNYVYNNVASNLGSYAELSRGRPYNLHSSVLETDFESPQYLSDYYVEDASFTRMDNITLGYAFNYHGQPARAFVAMQNAFTLTDYSGVDPTAGLNGLDNNIYPRSRTITAGLSFRF